MSRYTRTSLWVCLAGAGLLSAVPSASAGPADCDIGFHANFTCGGARPSLGPWYAYFPYDAHFQMPAPMGLYPNWPPAFPPPAAVVPVPFPPPPTPLTPPPPAAPRAAPSNQTLIQPVGYYPYGYGYHVPSYWYGR
jgi:hypothetical protein